MLKGVSHEIFVWIQDIFDYTLESKKLRIILKNIQRKVIGIVLSNIYHSDIFLAMLLLERFHHNGMVTL